MLIPPVMSSPSSLPCRVPGPGGKASLVRNDFEVDFGDFNFLTLGSAMLGCILLPMTSWQGVKIFPIGGKFNFSKWSLTGVKFNHYAWFPWAFVSGSVKAQFSYFCLNITVQWYSLWDC